ncbi:MAG: PaaI family thioesterase, partial [Alphaproteobacteria bacterium]|nr:PaaI family thioesterase [Alphaproteobacteria bacterium]
LSPGPIGGLIEAEVDLVGVTRTLVFLRLRVMAGHRTLMTADGTYKLFEPYEPGSRGRAGGTAVDGEPAAPPPPPDGYRPFPMQSEFARICGPVHYKRLPDGRFVNGFWTRAEHDNTSRVAHGGVLYTFADDFMGRTASAKGRRYTATVAMSVEYLAPGPLDTWLEGHAEVTGVDGDFAFVRGRVVHGERLILTADGIWRLLHPYVKPTGPKEDEE